MGHDSHFRRILDTSADGIIVVDADGQVAFVNPAAADLLGRSLQDLLGTPFGLPLVPGETTEVDIPRPGGDLRIAEMRTVDLEWEGRPACLATLRDVTERRITERALRESEERYRLLADNLDDHVILFLDTTGRVMSWNSCALRLTGHDEPSLLGTSFATFFGPEDRTENLPLRCLEDAIQLGNRHVDFWCARKSGHSFWAECFLTSLRDEEGHLRGFAALMRDRTERIRTMEELRHARDAADAANRAKSEFLANMSHEIRTPLGAMLGFAELMQNPRLGDGERGRCLETIQRNGFELARLIDEILDLSKVEAGHLATERIPFSLRSLLKELSALLALQAERKKIALEFHFREPPRIPDVIVSDPTRVRQILLNLVGNALKFTSSGKVELEVFVEGGDSVGPREGENFTLGFLVRDTGPGLSDEQQARLFQPFMQADTSVKRRFGGTGLGLALARRLAHLLGGELALLNSTPGQGSTFHLTLSVVAAAAEVSQPARAGAEAGYTSSATLLQGLKVLVVEDAIDNQVLVGRMLELSGAIVNTADDGLRGVERALGESFDVVLMDIQMPGLDGLEATKRLRSHGYRVPIIALTAHAMKDEKERCLGAGFDDYLTKPIDRALLLRKLARVRQNSFTNLVENTPTPT